MYVATAELRGFLLGWIKSHVWADEGNLGTEAGMLEPATNHAGP